MADSNGKESEDRVTERVVLERKRVLVVPDGVSDEQLVELLQPVLKGSRRVLVDEGWIVRGVHSGASKRQSIEKYAGKAGTPDAKVGVFKAPSYSTWKGGVIHEAPPKPLVQASLLED